MDSKELALRIRRDTIEMVHAAHASHIGSVLSVADMLAVLYTDVLNVDPGFPQMEARDRFVLSKGHAGAAVYAVLAECGFFPVEELKKYYMDGSVYSGHVSGKGVPGVELSTGSLGHGACVACGMALAAKRMHKRHQVYTIVGDGECEEGSIWEMALFAHKYCLDNFTVIVDNNKMQAMGSCEEVIALGSLGEKWGSFGWNVLEVLDGHDHDLLRAAFAGRRKGVPNVIIAHTVKGKGISFMEGSLAWHYKDPQGEAYENAVKELGEAGV
ncbi:MAG: transketolase [Eubacterium sp.]|jgi:Transketolase, N-terminal subunit|nr:transketolase [Eubacterium sp.]